MQLIDGKEVAKHNSKESCWLAINGTVWDVTDFVAKHPGGSHLILKNAGQDATDEYDEIHSPELVEESLGPKCRIGKVDATTIPKMVPKPNLQKQAAKSPPLSSMINLDDFEAVAEKTMAPSTWAYVSSGADDEITKIQNNRAYRKVFLRGRVLRDVGAVDSSTTILGQKSSFPVYTSPVGLAKLVHPQGECAIAAADGKEGVIQVVNTVSSMPIEAIMDARVYKDQPIFWQLYVDKDLKKSEAFVRRVEKCGVKAIWLTVDSPVIGKRERDDRAKGVVDIEGKIETVVETPKSQGIAAANTGFINASIDWSIVEWLRGITKLPIVVKGLQCVEDAILAYECGVDGIVLSNHGGRSQDTSQPPLLTLLEINKYAPHIIGKRMEIFVDGGIRRGTDIIKALALGATAVGVGRPVLYGLSAGYGKYGVRRMLQILRDEFQTNMAFVGAKNVKELRREMLNTRKLEKLMTGSVRL